MQVAHCLKFSAQELYKNWFDLILQPVYSLILTNLKSGVSGQMVQVEYCRGKRAGRQSIRSMRSIRGDKSNSSFYVGYPARILPDFELEFHHTHSPL